MSDLVTVLPASDLESEICVAKLSGTYIGCWNKKHHILGAISPPLRSKESIFEFALQHPGFMIPSTWMMQMCCRSETVKNTLLEHGTVFFAIGGASGENYCFSLTTGQFVVTDYQYVNRVCLIKKITGEGSYVV